MGKNNIDAGRGDISAWFWSLPRAIPKAIPKPYPVVVRQLVLCPMVLVAESCAGLLYVRLWILNVDSSLGV